MKTTIALTILVGLFSSCSNSQFQNTRLPSSVSKTQQSCSELMLSFNSITSKSYSLGELKGLGIELSKVKRNENFRALASLNGNVEVQEKTYYILALIKKQNPDDTADEVIFKYSRMLKECS